MQNPRYMFFYIKTLRSSSMLRLTICERLITFNPLQASLQSKQTLEAYPLERDPYRFLPP